MIETTEDITVIIHNLQLRCKEVSSFIVIQLLEEVIQDLRDGKNCFDKLYELQRLDPQNKYSYMLFTQLLTSE